LGVLVQRTARRKYRIKKNICLSSEANLPVTQKLQTFLGAEMALSSWVPRGNSSCRTTPNGDAKGTCFNMMDELNCYVTGDRRNHQFSPREPLPSCCERGELRCERTLRDSEGGNRGRSPPHVIHRRGHRYGPAERTYVQA
jgi:hypothetical protein